MVGNRKQGTPRGKVFKGSPRLQEKMSERKNLFAQWNLAVGTGNLLTAMAAYHKYITASNKVRDMLFKERKADQLKLRRLISKKGGRSSSMFWTEAKGEAEDQGINALKNSEGK